MLKQLILLLSGCCSFGLFAQTLVPPPLDTAKRETPSSVPAGNTQLSAPRNYNNLIRSNAITRKGLFIQCAPNDPRAQKMKLDEDLMGQIIRSVAAHELGHTLGLMHNFGASSSVPVENL